MEEGGKVFLISSASEISKREGTIMTKISKIIALTALITLAFGIVGLSNAMAGEKHKLRTVFYATKWEQLNVPGEEKHLIALSEAKGISMNMEGKTFGDGWVFLEVALYDIDIKTELGFGHGYGEVTDRDGDKIYYTWEGKRLRGKIWASYWKGDTTLVKGSGKYEGIKGKSTWSSYAVTPMQYYNIEEWEVELP